MLAVARRLLRGLSQRVNAESPREVFRWRRCFGDGRAVGLDQAIVSMCDFDPLGVLGGKDTENLDWSNEPLAEALPGDHCQPLAVGNGATLEQLLAGGVAAECCAEFLLLRFGRTVIERTFISSIRGSRSFNLASICWARRCVL